MKQFIAFTKKEILEQIRSGKLFIILIIFIVVGIMNPAITKLTPWIMDLLSDQLRETGMTIPEISVNALASWAQFYKNMPMAFIAFMIIFSGTFIVEFQHKTLINMITKGMVRYKIICSKMLVIMILWTVGFWICYGITYGYNAYLWDNTIVNNLLCSAGMYWLGCVWMISVIPLASALFRSLGACLFTEAAAFLVPYLLQMIPKLSKYMPTHLMDSVNLLIDAAKPDDYLWAIVIAIGFIIINMILAMVVFNKKEL